MTASCTPEQTECSISSLPSLLPDYLVLGVQVVCNRQDSPVIYRVIPQHNRVNGEKAQQIAVFVGIRKSLQDDQPHCRGVGTYVFTAVQQYSQGDALDRHILMHRQDWLPCNLKTSHPIPQGTQAGGGCGGTVYAQSIAQMSGWIKGGDEGQSAASRPDQEQNSHAGRGNHAIRAVFAVLHRDGHMSTATPSGNESYVLGDTCPDRAADSGVHALDAVYERAVSNPAVICQLAGKAALSWLQVPTNRPGKMGSTVGT